MNDARRGAQPTLPISHPDAQPPEPPAPAAAAAPALKPEIVPAKPKAVGTLQGFIEQNAQEFARVLPKHMTPDRMVRLAVSAVRTTQHLAECTLPSFASALMACSVLGLEPNTPLGHAYLIPFRNRKKEAQTRSKDPIYECQLIVGYKGLRDLMFRSGIVASVAAEPVFEGDEFVYEKGLHPDLTHRPGTGKDRGVNPGTLTHIYTVVKLRDGLEPIWDVLNRAQIEQRRKRSKAADDGPWVTDYVAMARKTGVRAIATWVPSSVEKAASPLAAAIAYEEALESGRPMRALTALGDVATEAVANMGAFPMPEDEEPEATEPIAMPRRASEANPTEKAAEPAA